MAHQNMSLEKFKRVLTVVEMKKKEFVAPPYSDATSKIIPALGIYFASVSRTEHLEIIMGSDTKDVCWNNSLLGNNKCFLFLYREC